MTEIKTNENQAVIDFVKNTGDVALVKLPDGNSVASVPVGRSLHPLKQYTDVYLKNPERYKGTSNHDSAESFIEHVLRQKDTSSVVFANGDEKNPKFTAVYNYNNPATVGGNDTKAGPAGSPRFGDHRAVLTCRLSDEWKIWSESNKDSMTQMVFAEFIEARILDITDAPDMNLEQFANWKQLQGILGYRFGTQAKIMQLSRGLTVHESSRVGSVLNLASGEASIMFESEHTDGNGNKVDVPQLFMITIPVFKDGPVYRFAARLRYRKAPSGINWSYDIYRLEDGFKNAYDDVLKGIASRTELPVFVGSPE